MINKTKKSTKTQTNTINSNKSSSKSKQQIDKEYYQKNKEHKKQQRKARYQQEKETEKAKQKQRYLKKKEREELTTKQIQAKYYGAEAIKILMSFKEYTELNKEKHKIWLDFNWTLKDCQAAIKEGLGDIVPIMKSRESADNLIRDFWETAKSKERKLSKNWNLLDYDQQQKLIRYWGYEKARIESGYINKVERMERQSQTYLKDLESAKFHEERGKINCPCYRCAESKRIQGEIKKELFKGDKTKKEQCPECKKRVKELDEEAGVCKRCKKKYE